MTWLLFMSGWLVAAVTLAVVMGRAIRIADEEDARHRQRMDEVEQRRQERMRRAMGDR